MAEFPFKVIQYAGDKIVSMDSPSLISAGQMLMTSKKSGLTFPAVLIEFPSLDDVSGGYRRWRVKLDFLRLNRVLQRYYRSKGVNSKTAVFPKKAYNRLCEAASKKPWMVPIESDRATFVSLRDSQTDDRKELKRVVHQLNLFLLHAFRLFDCLSKNEYKSSDEITVIEAWTTFVKNEDSPNLIDLDVSRRMNETGKDDGSMKAAALGQYFCSDKNAERIVNITLQYLFESTSYDDRIDLSECVLVEPSCGDGRIVHLLLDSLEKVGIQDNMMPYILGYDIDEEMICQSQQTCGRKNVYFKCCNFLQRSKEDLTVDVMHLKRIRDQQEDHQYEHNEFTRMRLVFLGGPPYSTGLGCGALIDRDLPLQFIIHSIINLGAEFVSFLLPLRCNKYIEEIGIRLNHFVSSDRSLEVSLSEVPCWMCKVISLDDDSVFHFKDSQIFQPSIIHCWMRNG